MLTGFLNLPFAARIFLVGLVALALARFVNWAIYNWAYDKRSLGPWAKPSKGTRAWQDRLPVIGWWRIRNEETEHGRAYWVRPLLIELLFPILIAWYYAAYVSGSSLPPGFVVRGLAPPNQLHWQFIGHFVLFTLMTVATFIDFDEQSIPDYVTVPGTAIGLFGAAFAPAWLPFHATKFGVVELDAAVPLGWPAQLDSSLGLAYALAIVAIWGVALLDRRWISRRGFRKAIEYFFARLIRSRVHAAFVLVVCLLLAGLVYYSWSNPARWHYVLSSLFGLAFAGGVTWAVRISASIGLGVEALGFGDVTLMAMIGTYIGWQPSLLVFFIAPLVAIVFVLIRAILTGDTATPYGPYLCAAAVLLLVYWDRLWNSWAAGIFVLGNMILGIVVACVALMGVMLWIWRLIKQAVGLAGN